MNHVLPTPPAPRSWGHAKIRWPAYPDDLGTYRETGVTAQTDMRFSHLSCGVVAVATLTAASCTGDLRREVGARIIALEGSASILRSPASPSESATLESVIRPGASLETARSSTASLFLLPGALLQIGPESALRLEKLALEKDGNATDEAMERTIQLHLAHGTLDLVVQFESNPGKCRVSTSTGTFSCTTPTTCRFQTGPSGTRITVVRGAIEIENGGGNFREIEAGFFTDGPAAANLQAIELDPQAQKDTEEVLQMEQKLLRIETHMRKISFPWRQL
ncbi:MAG: hypothetical protein ABI992_03990 [Chthoniobacterales bacterium]